MMFKLVFKELNLASSLEALNCGTMTVAKIPMRMTTIRISIRVKPVCC